MALSSGKYHIFNAEHQIPLVVLPDTVVGAPVLCTTGLPPAVCDVKHVSGGRYHITLADAPPGSALSHCTIGEKTPNMLTWVPTGDPETVTEWTIKNDDSGLYRVHAPNDEKYWTREEFGGPIFTQNPGPQYQEWDFQKLDI